MPDTPDPGLAPPGQSVDELCDRYEDAWLAGAPFPLEDLVRSAPENLRPELFRELVRLEQEYRTKASRPLTVPEARERYAELGSWTDRVIQELFGDTAVWCQAPQPPAEAVPPPSDETVSHWPRHSE